MANIYETDKETVKDHAMLCAKLISKRNSDVKGCLGTEFQKYVMFQFCL